MKEIQIEDVYEGNLKHISLHIPKQKLVVLCGISGSGKSTLAVDVLFNECQRQYLEALGMQGIAKPKVERIQHASPAILITQNDKNNRNPRSYIGTQTNIYTDLRMLYEKLGEYPCPHCHTILHPYECKEEIIKQQQQFHVYQYCPHCNERMDKLTRSHFSYNTREGACPHCEGFGESFTIAWENVFEEGKSLEDGAICIWAHKYLEYQLQVFYKALEIYHIPYTQHTPLSQIHPLARRILIYGVEDSCIQQEFHHVPKHVADGRFEGITAFLWRKVQEKGSEHSSVSPYFKKEQCPVCKGERLQPISRMVTVSKMRLPQVNQLSLDELIPWMASISSSLSSIEQQHVQVYIEDILTKCKRLIQVGLGYLSLDRKMATLSGGETQRLKLASALDCELDGLLYILDEPTIGLHPKDSDGLIDILHQLQEKGNTILVIEHDPSFIEKAEYIIEIGPQAGIYGGEVIFQGTYEQLLTKDTPTAVWCKKIPQIKQSRCSIQNPIHIEDACLHNLRHLCVDIPSSGLLCVSGVSGSGKSTLVFDVIGNRSPHVFGLEQFHEIRLIDQHVAHRSIRSNIATYSGAYTYIRACFAKQPYALQQHLDAKAFSFNSKGGRCEHCEGLGFVVSNRLFFQDVHVPCPVCHGRQFQEHVLQVVYKGYSIADILQLEIRELPTIFEDRKIQSILQLLIDCGLGYLSLGQSLTTLSGGEAQRLKFARELCVAKTNTLYLLDEPTVGLHPQDIDHFLILLQRLVDDGNTILMIEHNLQVLRASDYIIDMGVGGGIHGGTILAKGTPEELKHNKSSITGAYL